MTQASIETIFQRKRKKNPHKSIEIFQAYDIHCQFLVWRRRINSKKMKHRQTQSQANPNPHAEIIQYMKLCSPYSRRIAKVRKTMLPCVVGKSLLISLHITPCCTRYTQTRRMPKQMLHIDSNKYLQPQMLMWICFNKSNNLRCHCH